MHAYVCMYTRMYLQAEDVEYMYLYLWLNQSFCFLCMYVPKCQMKQPIPKPPSRGLQAGSSASSFPSSSAGVSRTLKPGINTLAFMVQDFWL